ncbi:MAG: 4-alpha-glucanotransferase [Arenicellales bacterium]
MTSTDTRLLEQRRAGLLLHVTSLPGPAARGRLGPDAFRFVSWLADAGFTVWQTLPLGPVGWDLSPYQSSSAFALEPALAAVPQVDKDPAAASGAELQPANWRAAAREFLAQDAANVWRKSYLEFLRNNDDWLEDFSLFTAIREAHEGKPWYDWETPLRDRDAGALRAFAQEHAPRLDLVRYQQFVLHSQWQALRAHAAGHGIVLFGDVPIFVAHDSADVWAHRGLFQLRPDGHMSTVAGVPPDYFSEQGQRWGQPLYDWEEHAAKGFRWWARRLAVQGERFDLLRLDHFRGFESCWAIDADTPGAANGAWQAGPGRTFFDAVRALNGPLPFVAENLGVITPEVERLRRLCGMPGMSVLQFGFDGNAGNANLPHNHERASVTYAGTHDNDTTLGWWRNLPAAVRDQVRDYLGWPAEPMPAPMVRAATRSVAALAVLTLQDLLELDSPARMNTPGRGEGNWRWRFSWSQIPEALASDTRRLLAHYGRSS